MYMAQNPSPCLEIDIQGPQQIEVKNFFSQSDLVTAKFKDNIPSLWLLA